MDILGRHIEALLQNNDCVVLPSFGAFIAHSVPAYYSDDERCFYPPSRSLSFNKDLTVDDGLLTAYLSAKLGIRYEEARKSLDIFVDNLREMLSIDGAVRLAGIGRLRQDIVGNITFEPETKTIEAPSFFGLDVIPVADLASLERKEQVQVTPQPKRMITSTEKTIDIHLGRQTLRHIASVAAVLLLLIVFALPVNDGRNTDIASLGISMEPVSQPVVTSLAPDTITVSPDDPEVAIVPAPVAIVETPPVPSRIYYVIVGSLPSMSGAEGVVKKYKDLGFEEATIVEGDGRVRISIASFTDKTEGEAYVSSLRENETFKHAWLLSVRNK